MFLAILTSILQILNSTSSKLNKKIDEATCCEGTWGTNIKSFENNFYRNEHYKNHFDKIDRKLKKLGNPLKLTPIRYYMLKVGVPIFLGLIGIINKTNKLALLFAAVPAFFLIDLIHRNNYKRVHKQIMRDLPDIYDILDIQTSAGAQIGMALTELYDVPRCERLKTDILTLAAEINIRNNIERPIDSFLEKYNYAEINSFGLAIKQALKTGKSKEMLENQSEYLKHSNIFAIQEETKNIKTKMGTIALFLFLGALLLLAYAFLTQGSQNTQSIFK